MTDTDIIEAVARAIYEAAKQSGEYVGDYRFYDSGETTLDGQFDLNAIARAALSAIEASGTHRVVPVEEWQPNVSQLAASWQPIETAPKPGEHDAEVQILLYEPGDGVVIGAWDLNTDFRHEPGGWPVAATHWQPLPSPPASPKVGT